MPWKSKFKMNSFINQWFTRFLCNLRKHWRLMKHFHTLELTSICCLYRFSFSAEDLLIKFAIPGNNYAKKSWWVYGSIIKEAQMIIERVFYCTYIAKLIMTPFHSKVTVKTCSKNYKTDQNWPFWKHVKNALIEFCE